MTEGPLDNYLTAEEDAYFKNRGSDEAEEKVEESFEEENGKQDTQEVTQEAEQDVLEDRDRDNSEEVSADEDDEASEPEDSTSSKRDYEKAFKAERHKRKELKEAFEAHAKKTAEMEAMLARMQENMEQQTRAQQEKERAPQVKEVVPDPEEDPIGYQQYKIDKLEQSLTEQSKYLKQQHEYSQRAAQENAFKQAYMNAAQQFSQKNNDFTDAYKFLTNARAQEHMAAGFSREEAESLLLEEEAAIVAKAFKDKVNPAERMYNLAKNRGYSAKAAPASKGKSLTDIKKGMDNAKSLKSGGGQLPDKDFGLDDIDAMNFDEFDKFWAGYKSKSKGIG